MNVPTFAAPSSLELLGSEALTDEDMAQVTGETSIVLVVIGFIGSVIAADVIGEVLDYYNFSEWMQETAIPAVEKAVVEGMETLGDTCLEYPMACAPVY